MVVADANVRCFILRVRCRRQRPAFHFFNLCPLSCHQKKGLSSLSRHYRLVTPSSLSPDIPKFVLIFCVFACCCCEFLEFLECRRGFSVAERSHHHVENFKFEILSNFHRKLRACQILTFRRVHFLFSLSGSVTRNVIRLGSSVDE